MVCHAPAGVTLQLSCCPSICLQTVLAGTGTLNRQMVRTDALPYRQAAIANIELVEAPQERPVITILDKKVRHGVGGWVLGRGCGWVSGWWWWVVVVGGGGGLAGQVRSLLLPVCQTGGIWHGLLPASHASRPIPPRRPYVRCALCAGSATASTCQLRRSQATPLFTASFSSAYLCMLLQGRRIIENSEEMADVLRSRYGDRVDVNLINFSKPPSMPQQVSCRRRRCCCCCRCALWPKPRHARDSRPSCSGQGFTLMPLLP